MVYMSDLRGLNTNGIPDYEEYSNLSKLYGTKVLSSFNISAKDLPKNPRS